MINKSLKIYITVNTIFLLLGYIQYKSILLTQYSNIIYNFCSLYLIYVTKNYFLLNFTDFITKKKLRINKDESKNPVESYKYEFHRYVLFNTLIESTTYFFTITKIINIEQVSNIYFDLLYFIPVSFLYEIIFDLFYYSIHRLFHNKNLYKVIHKTHHKHKHPIGILLYYQDPFEWFLITTVPNLIPLYVLPNISFLQFNIILVYKTALEIAGHCGKKIYPATSFPQMPWLVKYLNIELHTEDHDLHHSLNNCNYGKRFSLWDKVFNTYKSGHEYYLKNENINK
jgi:sterol desaturase/sphingolipid hydroxylase (fatty acid hydroxylase superfamily)